MSASFTSDELGQAEEDFRRAFVSFGRSLGTIDDFIRAAIYQVGMDVGGQPLVDHLRKLDGTAEGYPPIQLMYALRDTGGHLAPAAAMTLAKEIQHQKQSVEMRKAIRHGFLIGASRPFGGRRGR
jgi:hypothetical protein